MILKVVLLSGLALAGCQREAAAPLEASAGGPSQAAAPAGQAETASPQQFADLLGKGNVLLLDVRTAGEVARGRIAGATNIDIGDPAFGAKIRKMQKNKTILVYCAVGGRSAEAVPQLIDAGFAHVINLQGGIVNWSRAGLPVERSEQAPPSTADAMSPGQFDALLAKEPLVLADFHTAWCAPCQRMAPVVDELAKKYQGKAKILRVDIESSAALAEREKIDGVPVFVVYRGGKEAWRASGEMPAAALEAQLTAAK